MGEYKSKHSTVTQSGKWQYIDGRSCCQATLLGSQLAQICSCLPLTTQPLVAIIGVNLLLSQICIINLQSGLCLLSWGSITGLAPYCQLYKANQLHIMSIGSGHYYHLPSRTTSKCTHEVWWLLHPKIHILIHQWMKRMAICIPFRFVSLVSIFVKHLTLEDFLFFSHIWVYCSILWLYVVSAAVLLMFINPEACM
jgi:hypothetical protein